MNKKEAWKVTVYTKAKKEVREIGTAETVRVLKTPKTESSARKVFIPRSVAQYLIELKQEQDEIKAALGNEYHDEGTVKSGNSSIAQFPGKDNESIRLIKIAILYG